ncbi:hypothetical protein WJX72_008987 [[Myrmecia] bisecta]|uniref:Selenoprotein O n=1 Tax=[Myrmecia] bisecta TaxID=41462 RepID=A0AAW1PI36_9CHLO
MVTRGHTSLAEPATDSVGLKTLEDLALDSTFTRELPGDPDTTNKLRQVHGAFYSFVSPTPTGTEPSLVTYSPEVAAILGLDPAECSRPEFALIFSGQAPAPGSAKSYAHCYGGHQFGSWAGQLGDGRAISLGEVAGRDGPPYELQLKGAGKTPYSRMADGRAVMRSSLREFVASEAMHHLGVPTTRALSLVSTGDQVLRDMFYNGNAKLEPGAVVCRVSRSFVRFGSFQLPASRGGMEVELVRTLADFVIRHHYPHLEGREDKYVAFLREVTERTARLVARWQTIGFVHGVLNTDNMSILGETIDYGPYGFLERFNPNFTPNTTDLHGERYTYRNQPEVVQWNLAQFAGALVAAKLMEKTVAEETLVAYADTLEHEHVTRMANKFGLRTYDRDLSIAFLTNLYTDQADFTNSFRVLSAVSQSGDSDELPGPLAQALGELDAERTAAWQKWIGEYKAVLRAQGVEEGERRQRQDSANPAYIPRNHVMQDIIKQVEQGDYTELHCFMDALKTPYIEQPGLDRFRVPAPVKIRFGVELLSCSS